MSNENSIDQMLGGIADAVGGTLNEVAALPDGSGFATMSFPLPEDHWLYKTDESGYTGEPSPNMLLGAHHPNRAPKATRDYFEGLLKPAIRYGVRAATSCGRDNDFDPDALVNNAIIGLMGFYTVDGRTSNPEDRDGRFDVQEPKLFKDTILELLRLAIIDGELTFTQIADATRESEVEKARMRLQKRRERHRLAAEERMRQSGLEHERRRSISAERWATVPVHPRDQDLSLEDFFGIEIWEFTFAEGDRLKKLGAVMSYETQQALLRLGVAVHKLDKITPVGQDFSEGSCTFDFSCCRPMASS